MKKVIKHPKKMKNAMYIVFGVFALALFAITRIHPIYANEGLMIDDALDAIVLYGEVDQLPEDEEVEEVQDEKTQEIEQAQDIKKEDIVEPELTPEEKAEELDENSQDLENDEENLDGEEVDNRKNGENEDGDKEGKTEEIEGTSETEEGDNEPEVQIPEVSSDEENHGVGDNEPSEEAISEKNEQFSILTGNFVLKTADVGNTITITYNTNLGEFEDGENTKDVVYTYTEPTEGTKYSHTPNISDAGVQSGNYSDNLANNHTIGIPGSLKLHISLNYATEKSYDYLYIFKGTYTGTPTKNMKEGQLYTFNGDSSNTLKTSDFYVDGDEVTFSFYSDSSSNYYGYYATIEGIGGYVTDETVEKPVREGYSFMGWYETGAENPYDFSQKVTENKILYAKRDVAKTITYNANGGSFKSGTNSMITQDVIYTRQNDGTYIPDNNIQFPNKISDNMAAQSGWMFDGWYTSTTNQTASTEWTGYVNENTQSQTVYAKWLPFNDLKVDIGGTGFTIMDRNLGATSNDISSSNSYGKYYQWGNNYGFSTYDISLLNTSSIKVDETPYGPGNYYSSATYITTDDGIRTQDYDFGNLWGGNTNTDEAMQGPCPIGYHVSSSDDIWDVYEAFQYWVYNTDEGEDFCSNYDNHAECFSVKTHLPLAGYYDDYNKTINQNDGYYWTSYKKSWPSALILMIESSDPYGGYPAINGFRMGGLLPVRCFKNAPQLFTVTFNPNGGEVEGESSLTTDNEGKVILPGATREPNENGERVFEGWFASTGVSEKIGNSGDVITLDADKTVYAHWAQTITIFDLKNPLVGFTVLDRNLGAVSSGIDDVDSYGFYYQWGNNHGHLSGEEMTAIEARLEYKSEYDGHGYDGKEKRHINIAGYPDIWENNNSYPNLWGGGSDSLNESNGFVYGFSTGTYSVNNVTDRQGPCPDGYHVPSYGERAGILNLYYESINQTGLLFNYGTIDVSVSDGDKNFINALHLPYAGHTWSNFSTVSDDAGLMGYYWTSTPASNTYESLAKKINKSSGSVDHDRNSRAYGYSVRCFKNEYEAPAPQSVTVTYNANGGKFADNSTTTGIIYSAGTVINPKESLVPTRDGYIFTGWYTAINGGTEVTGHTVLESRELYAHWVDDVTQTRREGCFQFRNLTNTTVEITDYSDSCSRNLADEGGIPSIITRGDKGYTVTSIGYQAFNNSDNRLIGSVVIPETVEVISGYAFSFNNITGLYLGSGVRTIGMYAYANNKNLSGVVFGDNLSSIEEYAFYNSALGRVDINSIDSIGRNAFQNNPITVVNILDDSCVISAWAFYNNPIITLNLDCGGDIQESTFSSNNLRILTLGSGVTSIGYNVFSQSKIEEIIIPDSVTYIGRNAFQYNYNLEKIKIGNGVTEIGEYAFSNNTALENLDLGESLEIIGNYAFYESSDNLTGLKIPDSVQTIGNYAFGFLDNLGYIKLGSGLKNVGQFAFAGAMNFSGTMLPDSIENLGTGAFCTDQKQDEGSVVGLVSSNVTDEQIQTLESQENTACFVIKRDKYNIKLSGANEGSDVIVELPYNSEFDLSTYSGTKSGWYFEGWASDSASTGALSDNPVVTGELVLYPIFRKDLIGTFNKDSSVSSITTNSATCTLWNNESSCTLTAPTINCANGYSNGVWSPLSMTISENTTFTASCNDVQKPVCNISTQPTRTLMSMVNGYNQGTVTFTCTDNVGVSTNNLSASNITYDSDVVTLSNFIVGGTSTSKTFTFTYTAKVAGNTSFTLKAGVVSDVAGNSNLVTSASNSVTVDTTAPVLSTKTSFENIWYTANQTSTFTYTDTGAGITAGENTASCTISTEGIASTCQITPNICDKVGNCNTTFQTSNSIKLNKTAPVFTGKTQFTTGWYNTDQTSIFIYEDTVSGISGANTTSCVINEEGTAAKCTVENTNICNNAGLCNTANQTSNSIKLDKTNPTCSITGNPTSPINQDVELTLNYLVESNQISTGYSWDGEVYTSTQKFTVTQNGTYTGYVRDAAGNTGSCSMVVDKIDRNLPVITINNPDTTTAQSKTITATKSKGTLYMSITGANVCDSTLEFVAYAEITFNLEADNGKYVCYKAEDDAGNVAYKISNQIAGIKEPSKSSGGGGGTKKSETDTKEIAIDTSTDQEHNSADEGQKTETNETSNTPSNEETSNQVISVTQEILEDGTPVEVVIQTVAIKNTDIVATVRTETVQSNTVKSSSSRFTKEENDAYSFAKSNGITTTDSIDNAKMNTELTRIQMAKMLSNFAINVLGEEPDVSKGTIKFDDVTNKMDDQYDNAVTKAYQLGIMGQNMKNNEFRPNDEVTRAEFASALSRLLYKTDEGKYRSTGKYYIPHVAKLYNEGIINKTDPKIKEKRGYVMLMLMRTVQ